MFQPSKGEVDLIKFYSLDIPKSYINCTEDMALPPGEWGWHPRMSNGLGLYRLVQVSGSVLWVSRKMLNTEFTESTEDTERKETAESNARYLRDMMLVLGRAKKRMR